MLLRYPFIVSFEKIWDQANHAGLTDLIQFKEEFFCIFREADSSSEGVNGILRLLHSRNGIVWDLLTTLEWEGWDLRDPKLSITPDGRLMLLAGASLFNRNRTCLRRQSVVCFSNDGSLWSDFLPIFNEECLWRLTWFQGLGYGVSYFCSAMRDWALRLYRTADGITYEPLSSFQIPGPPSEVTLRFFQNQQVVALIRRDGFNDKAAWIGMSFPPYEDWLFSETSCYLRSPNFLILPDEIIWASGKIVSETPYGQIEKVAILDMTLKELRPKLILPSSGDCGCPGMVYKEPFLWISYHSSHEGHSSIYLAQIACSI